MYCVVVDVIDRTFVIVEGLKVRRRRSNVNHLAPTPESIELKKGAKTDAVKKAIEKAGLTEKFSTRIKLDL